MPGNRVSMHIGKNGSAKHNDHDFKEENKDVVIRSVFRKSEDGTRRSLIDSELMYYTKHYSKCLQLQNEKYIAKGQYGRCKTMKELYESPRYKPSEMILQYGHAGGENPSKENFKKIVYEFEHWLANWSREHGSHLHLLSIAIHFDETSPHCHLRYIWDYDDNGICKIGQEKGMEQAGIELPDPKKKTGRYNNRGIPFTAMCREKFQDICEDYGYSVERIPLSTKKKHESVEEYQARQARSLVDYQTALTKATEKMKSMLYQLNNDLKKYDAKLFSEDEFLKMIQPTLLQKQAQVSKHTESAESHEKIDKYRDTVSKAEDLISMNGEDFGYQLPV